MGLLSGITSIFGGGGSTGNVATPNVKQINTAMGQMNPNKFQTPEQTGFLNQFGPAATNTLNSVQSQQSKLGTLDPGQFNATYAPVKAELGREQAAQTGTLESSLASRGLLPQGSFAPGSNPSTAGSSSTYGGPMGELEHEQGLQSNNAMQTAAQNVLNRQAQNLQTSTGVMNAEASPYESNIVNPTTTLSMYDQMYGGQNTANIASMQAKNQANMQNRGQLWNLFSQGQGNPGLGTQGLAALPGALAGIF